MKRKFKRIASLVLAMVMVFAMAMPAMASSLSSETYDITIKNKNSGHTYAAYQIFKGTKVNDTSEEAKDGTILSNADWGNGISEAGQAALLAMKGDGESYTTVAEFIENQLKTAADAKRIADFLEEGNHLQNPITGFTVDGSDEAGYTYTKKDVDAGYYLVMDNANPTNPHDARTSYIIQVVGDTEVNAKSDVPTVDKTVEDDTDIPRVEVPTQKGDDGGYGETADHQINEKFHFKLTANLPAGEDGLSEYEKYELIFHDTMSKGLTYDGDVNVTVTIDNDPEDDATYTLSLPEGAVATGTGEEESTTLTVRIEDLLSANFVEAGALAAVQAAFGEKNITVDVTYVAHLNEKAVIAETEAGDTNAEMNEVYLEYSNNPNHGGEGTGRTPEDKVHVFTYDLLPNKVDENEEPLAGAKFKLYSDEGCTTEIKLAKDTDGNYYPIADQERGTGTEMESDEDGNFHIKGLDIGTYYLKETASPAGYNILEDPVKLTITADYHAEATDGNNATTKFEKNGNTTIKNQKGTTLPETGGIGTTIFYVVGSVLVLGAVILLVTKRRMKAD